MNDLSDIRKVLNLRFQRGFIDQELFIAMLDVIEASGKVSAYFLGHRSDPEVLQEHYMALGRLEQLTEKGIYIEE